MARKRKTDEAVGEEVAAEETPAVETPVTVPALADAAPEPTPPAVNAEGATLVDLPALSLEQVAAIAEGTAESHAEKVAREAREIAAFGHVLS